MRPSAGLLGILLIALAVRLTHVAEIRDSITFESPLVDAYTYDREARAVAADGPGAIEVPYYQPPAYSFGLGAVYAATGGSYLAPRLLQAAAGAATVGLVFLLAAAAGGARAGWIAAGLLTLAGPVIYFEGELLPPAWILLLGTGALWLLARADGPAGDAPGPAPAPGAGERPAWSVPAAALLLGTATAIRPTVALLAAAAAVWWARKHGGVSRRSVPVLAAFFLPILPFALANGLGGREAVLVSWNGGINFYLGNGAGSDSLTAIQPGFAWDRLQREPLRAGVSGRAAESSYWTRRALREAAADPVAWAGALGRKALRFLDARETPRNTDWEAWRGDSRVLGLARVGFGWLGPLALLGLLAPRVPGRFRSLMGVAVGVVLVENLLFFVAGRYRVQAYPALAALAGAGVAAVTRGGFRTLPVRSWLLVLAAAVLVHADWLGERGVDETRAAINRGVALRRAGNDGAAEREFRRAVALRPQDPDAHRWLGELALAQGDPQRAEAHFDLALAAAPDYLRVLLAKAAALERGPRAAEADAVYRRALEVDPWSTDTFLNYGVYLARSGRDEDARRAFLSGLRLDPADGRFRRNLDRLSRGS